MSIDNNGVVTNEALARYDAGIKDIIAMITAEKNPVRYKVVKSTSTGSQTYSFYKKDENDTEFVVDSASDAITVQDSIDSTSKDPVNGAAVAAEFTTQMTTQNINSIIGYTPMDSSIKGAANGVASLDGLGQVPVSQLPVVDTYSATGTKPITGTGVAAALATLPEPMVFKGTVGTGGTVTSLPTAANSNKGHTYKAISDNIVSGSKIGDTFISTGSAWVTIPSGDEPSGTVTQVGINASSGSHLSALGTVTSSGTLTVGVESGYQIPSSSDVSQISTNQSNILYGLENGVKNILPVVFESRTTYGITCINNGDGSITVNGTNSQSSGTIILANIQSSVRGGYDDPRNFLGKNKDYVLVGNTTTANLRIQILGWNSSSDNSILASSTTDTVSFNTGNWNYISVRMWVQGSATFSNIVIKPMICTAESYAQSTTYQPPALSNSALTEGLIDAIDTNGKNRLKLDIDWIKANNTVGSWSGNAYTYKGVTFTLNNDGTVSTTGTTNADTVTFELMSYKFVSGVTYRLSGCPAGGSLSTYRLGTRGSAFLRDYGLVDNTTDNVNVGDDETRNVFIYIASANVDMTGKTYRPMLCTKAEWDTSPKFQPYALPNYDLTRMVSDLQKKAVKVYTYHVNPNESDPEDAVTYLDDATGLTPAKMGASSFSYGSWANAWFLPRPCVLKFDGTVDYYLNPNDYSKKTDGTASTIDSSNSTGNVMLEFPKIWVKRVNDGNGARTVSIAPVNVDGTYKCWSNINAEDKEVDHFYLPAYNGTIHSSKMRSLSGVTLNSTYAPNKTRAEEVTLATANNPTGKNMWYTETWADMCLVYDLLYLMGKSLDVQRTFGQGLSSGSETAMRAYVTGTHNAKGLFYGDISGTSTAVKVLGMENLWGCRWHGVAGLINDNGTLKVKMTYGVADGSTAVGYNTTGSGYLSYGSTYGTNGFVKKIQADNTMGYKIIETGGSDATYYCDYYYVNNSQLNYALMGGSADSGSYCGFYVSVNDAPAAANWRVGAALSCRP